MPDARFPLFATTAKGLEDLLFNELQSFGIDSLKQGKGGVYFDSTISDALKACLWSRIANRILLQIKQFDAPDEESLYNEVSSINWQDYFDCSSSFAIDCNLQHSNLNHSQYAALKTKDAIVDYFREQTGERPNIETQQPDIRLNLYINNDKATLSLDLAGDSLHKRGYRKHGEHAPLKENLAAAILLRSQWPKKALEGKPFLDPMCGSGTLVIEAAMIAADIAPGLIKEYWGFFKWKDFDGTIWQTLIDEALKRREAGLQKLPSITGYDQSIHAIRAATLNATAAGLNEHIHLEKRDITQATPRKQDDKGIIVVNPPYGERLSNKPEVSELYKTMGEQFQQQFLDWDVSVFTDSLELGRSIPLRAKKIHSLYNGALECKLLHFRIDPKLFFDTNRKFRTIPAEKRGENAKMFENRLSKNVKHLKKWAKRENIDCYRVYDADLPEYALAIDLYYSKKLFINVQEYEAPKSIDPKVASQRLNEALNIIVETFQISVEQLHIKTRKQQKGKQQYQKLDDAVEFEVVQEGGHQFYINFANYLDTGLFLDHRTTRAMVQSMAKGCRFLNLFSYTSSVTVYAAKGGATSTTSIDMSNTYIDWSANNLDLNELIDHDKHKLIRANCVEWLKQEKDSYDLIFLDPPSFSNSKKMEESFSIQRDHVSLLKDALDLLSENGKLIFSNNLRNFKLDESAFDQVKIENITEKTIPEDFKRNKKIHNCWVFSKLSDF